MDDAARSTVHRLPLLLLGVVLLLGAAAAVMTGVKNRPDNATDSVRDFKAGESTQADAHAAINLLDAEALADPRLLTPPGAAPDDRVPADLTLPNRARRLIGYRQKLGGIVERIGVWAIEGAEAEALVGLLSEQAMRSGFSAFKANTDDAKSSRLLVRGDEVLLIRAGAGAEAVRLTVILRYTSAE